MQSDVPKRMATYPRTLMQSFSRGPFCSSALRVLLTALVSLSYSAPIQSHRADLHGCFRYPSVLRTPGRRAYLFQNCSIRTGFYQQVSRAKALMDVGFHGMDQMEHFLTRYLLLHFGHFE
jgi:hypothetical protein